jgi:hypothetical protein
MKLKDLLTENEIPPFILNMNKEIESIFNEIANKIMTYNGSGIYKPQLSKPSKSYDGTTIYDVRMQKNKTTEAWQLKLIFSTNGELIFRSWVNETHNFEDEMTVLETTKSDEVKQFIFNMYKKLSIQLDKTIYTPEKEAGSLVDFAAVDKGVGNLFNSLVGIISNFNKNSQGVEFKPQISPINTSTNERKIFDIRLHNENKMIQIWNVKIILELDGTLTFRSWVEEEYKFEDSMIITSSSDLPQVKSFVQGLFNNTISKIKELGYTN